MALLYTDNEWTFDRLKIAEEAIHEIALEELHLNVYPNQIEIIASDQMLDAYSSVGLPMMYSHWSFGKKFIQENHNYRKGLSGLAYEIVINSNPCISYLMEENSMTMQTLVIAHAAYGHNHVFKNNYLFKQFTDASAILDYLEFAKNYINDCEERYGPEQVEIILDAAHALQYHGIDRYKRAQKLSKQKELERQKERMLYLEKQVSELWNTIPKVDKPEKEEKFIKEPQENLLYFLEKNSPILKPWQREILRIVRKLAQYFYPQMQTKVLNEGWASFTHYYIMNRLWEKELINEGHYLEFIHSHSSVLRQIDYNSKYYYGYNPYALGFSLFSEIKRICLEPTKEDEIYFPHLVGKDWLEECLHAVENFRDESFILQYLSPKLIRDWKLFAIHDEEKDDYVTISDVHEDYSYDNIRKILAQSYSVSSMIPDIQITDAKLSTSRELVLKYTPYKNRKLKASDAKEVIDHIKTLWGYDVTLIS